MSEQKVKEVMREMGFLVMEHEEDTLYLMDTPNYFLVVVESHSLPTGRLVYDFNKYVYHKEKDETRLVKNYFRNISAPFMIQKVRNYLVFLLNKGLIRSRDPEIETRISAIRADSFNLFE